MNVYFLSGLGADKRAFSKLRLDDRFSVKYIDWITPLRDETLHHYAERLAVQIDTTQPFQLVGLSFGGIMASELSEIVNPQQIIIISSTSVGIPISSFYQALLKVLLVNPFAAPFLKSANTITYKYFGADTPELKDLLKSILHDTDSRLLKWALIKMSSWQRKKKADNLFHIHGTADKLIPIKLVQPDLFIQDGSHLMVFKQHEIISSVLNKQLQ